MHVPLMMYFVPEMVKTSGGSVDKHIKSFQIMHFIASFLTCTRMCLVIQGLGYARGAAESQAKQEWQGPPQKQPKLVFGSLVSLMTRN